MKEIRVYGDPVLRKKAEAVRDFDRHVAAFVAELTERMRTSDGVGLAAPQVGESVRIAVVDPTGGEQNPIVLVNPRITMRSDETENAEEGCLSVPDIRLKVTRPARVSVAAQNEKGEEFTISEAGDLLARVLQHEIDHLDGILFVDRVSPLQRQMVNGKLKKLAKSQKRRSAVA